MYPRIAVFLEFDFLYPGVSCVAKIVPIHKKFFLVLGGIMVLCVALTIASIIYISVVCGTDSFAGSEDDNLPGSSLLNCYYYNILPAAEQKLYLSVLLAAEKCASMTEPIDREYTPDEYKNVMLALTADHPRLFYIDIDNTLLQTAKGKSRIILSYYASVEEISNMQEKLSLAVTSILDKAEQSANDDPEKEIKLTDLGEFERELLLHDFFCDAVSYYEKRDIGYGDDMLETGNPETESENLPADDGQIPTDIDRLLADTAYGALVGGKAFSGGYAMGIKYLLNSAGIMCDVVRGTADGSPHMWNIVYIDGKFYHLDSTYNDGDIEFAPELRFHGYFNLSSESIKMDHTIDREEILPVAQQEYDYYHAKGLIAENLMELDRIAYREVLNAVYSGKNYIELYPTFSREGDSFKADLLNVISRVNKNQDKSELKVVFRVYNASATNNALTIQLFYVTHEDDVN